MMEELKLIGERIRDQDNQCTSHAVFLVQSKKRNYGYDPNYGNEDCTVWINTTDRDVREASEVEAAVLEELEELRSFSSESKYAEAAELEEFWDISADEWTETSYQDTWEYEAACFTQVAADEYIARHKHNLKEPRVYVDSGWRNEEWQLLRKFLLSLVEPPTQQ